LAKPFTTHHNALGADLFLRIAPETYLKRAVAAGFDKVFEIGKNFRNEGIDPSHLQEFTSVEWYSAYNSSRDNLFLFMRLLDRIFDDLNKHNPWATMTVKSYREIFAEFTGGTNPDSLSPENADAIFKTKVRPNLTGAWVITDYPAHLSPMAARTPGDSNTADQWQFIVDGWEVVKCYTELTDPVLQRQLLEEQALAKAGGNEEAMALEEDFLECMEHGMPPMSGIGIGIDRLVCLITGQKTLRDVVLFPTLLKKSE
jgi:lysyl-tRNA synthetase class 2